jgi:brefeldin A-inhibited guanine nucleotide-exchange protein
VCFFFGLITLFRVSKDILRHFNGLDPTVKQKNMSAWRPVVATILTALERMDDDRFRKTIPDFYEDIVKLVTQEDVGVEIRGALYNVLIKCGSVFNVTKVQNLNIENK